MRALAACAEALASAGHRMLVRIFDEDVRQAVRRAAPAAELDASDDFGGALARCRCVIGTPSSVLLEAMQHDRPTATLVFRDSPLLYPTGWLLGGFADWRASFRSMLARDPERMALQQESLRDEPLRAGFLRADRGDRPRRIGSPPPAPSTTSISRSRIGSSAISSAGVRASWPLFTESIERFSIRPTLIPEQALEEEESARHARSARRTR